MKRYVAIALLCAVALCPAATHGRTGAVADSAATVIERINASGDIEVVVPAALEARLQKVAPAADADAADTRDNAATQGRVGYRIQVFDDNSPRTARSEAQSRKRQMESRFPEWRSYVQFNSPYWRVKVGDFRTRGEAEAAIEDMRRAFPGISQQLRIVRDRINIAE